MQGVVLTKKALRRVPEGGVYACTRTPTDTNALQEQASTLPELISCGVAYHIDRVASRVSSTGTRRAL